ncbi:symmetrical bis(5'-nucleosyl)-tetraphosphatase [Buchnera aphidicola]|uniref:bis(5'-nucleosyl)-tetraphosphatase (symmetrical) n=1 Tax=Buchnera aphidicola (Aphis nerii) TaxID=1241835 RepID=A0A4D6XVR7_9GAMM|nr:symmetrical bis(5'-nucleosyl)-tetraphosphatase [Buchnera aphidicola]QCI18704.1 symmetrical bis(5'-nucleosyl)-tetraphosphatase [Buchnera aphidicola (Aphis nerii)]
MSIYFISDIHGCYKELKLLLKKSHFNINNDYLWIAGDLVSRGRNSLEVMRYLYSIKDRIKVVLGNHDLNLIAVYSGIQKNKKENYFDDFLSAHDSDQLINWLRSQSILKIDKKQKIIMVHAGISPQLNLQVAQECSLEIEACLLSNNYPLFLKSVLNNKISYWDSNYKKIDQLRYGINVFTRIRYCYPDGKLNLTCKQSPSIVKYPLLPWFLISNEYIKKYSIIFGHWSSLKGTNVPSQFFPLDHGCCWGGELSILRWEDKKYFHQSYQR